MDPLALITEVAAAVPAVGAAMGDIIAFLAVKHPELDLSALGESTMLDARERALKEANE